jgi:hypothetical protein
VLPRVGLDTLAGRKRGRDLIHHRVGDAARGQVTHHLEILIPVEQPGLRWRAVPAGPAELLVVPVERGRRVTVHHPAHVRLVDSHPERDRGRDDAGRPVHERGHRLMPRAGGQPGVVERYPLACRCQRVVCRLGAGVRRRVDDPLPIESGHRPQQLVLLVGDAARAVRRQVNVRPVKVADHHLWIAQPEPPHDFPPHRRRGGRGQGKPDGCADRLGLCSEQHVVRAEVAAPLADQVRFVNSEKTRLSAPQRLAGLLVRQLLRRKEDKRIGIARGQQRRSACARGLLGVQDDRPQAGRTQVGELIILQCDQRRDDHRGPRSQHPRQLVDRRFPAAGRQQGQHVAVSGQRFDRAQLPGTKPGKAQALTRELLDHGSAQPTARSQPARTAVIPRP